MIIEPIIFIFLALILIGVREGLVIKDMLDNKPSPMESRWWHRTGLAIRSCLILAVFLLVKPFGYESLVLWIYTGISILLASIWYDIAINLIEGNKWYYVGPNGIDGFIRKILFFINFDK